MPSSHDPRIPVILNSSTVLIEEGAAVRAAPVAWLIEGTAPAPGAIVERFALSTVGHAPGCVCCGARDPVAQALGRLFLGRVRGEVAFFSYVLALPATAAGVAAIAAALQSDMLVAARFRAG